MNSSNYWVDFWKEYSADASNLDEQSQVLRTFNKKPISEELWSFTLNKIDENFNVKNGDTVLDLCSGNGLLSKHFVSKGAEVTAVDVSKDLLNNIKDYNKIRTIESDIRLLDFNKNSFDKIILYAGIQYFDNKETITLLKKMYDWLKPNGVLFIGDIPDYNKLWNFYNTEERQKVYFDNILSETAIVGNWFEPIWFNKLTGYFGFSKGEYIPQNDKLIYSSFRFDFCYKK